MIVQDITSYIESIAPLNLQESYDNAGLIVGSPEMELKSVLLCLDSTESIVEEAIEKGCNLIIAHHPIVFSGLKQLNGKNYIERTVINAIKNDIAIYASHTNLDNVFEGVSRKIAEKIGLANCKILSPSTENEQIGSGMVGYLPEAMNSKDFLKTLKSTMNTQSIKHTRIVKDTIKKVAVCGGAGSFLLDKAIREEADVFITGDFKYHQFFDADGKIIIADIGHYESEQYTMELLHDLLTKKFPTFAFHLTNINTNPVNYL